MDVHRLVVFLNAGAGSVGDESISAIAEAFEEASSARIDIDDLLETLPKKQARVIRATRIEGLSVAEAAAADGIGESDVKVSVHRGLKSLMARIQGGGQ